MGSAESHMSSRRDDIESCLRRLAPRALEVCEHAQQWSEALIDHEILTGELSRGASRNQVGGQGRWRSACDRLVGAPDLLPPGIAVLSSDADHNQGRYFIAAAEDALLFTFRRDPKPEEKPGPVRQLKLAELVKQVPVSYGSKPVTVYISVPPAGEEATFEVEAANGTIADSYEIRGLVDTQSNVEEMPQRTERRSRVQSVLDQDAAEEAQGLDG